MSPSTPVRLVGARSSLLLLFVLLLCLVHGAAITTPLAADRSTALSLPDRSIAMDTALAAGIATAEIRLATDTDHAQSLSGHVDLDNCLHDHLLLLVCI